MNESYPMRLTDRLLLYLRGGLPEQEERNPSIGEARTADRMITTKRAELVDLLEANGGRMKQSDLVSMTDWSASTVSRELAEMEEDGLVHKISIGRSNLVALIGAEPDWYTPPEPIADGDPSGTARDRDAILLIEDDEQDATILRRAFSQANVQNPIHTVRDGFDAVEFLRKDGPYADAPTPALVLLDLQLLVIDGVDVLREFAERDNLRGYPIVVLSHSDDPDDIRRSYEAGATAYLTKPPDLDGLVELANAIESFWLSDAIKHPPAPAEHARSTRLIR